MNYLIYLSAGTEWLTGAELNEVLDISRKNNSRDGITGLLLYGDGNFIQLLEGEKAMTQKTFARISSDPRHKGITHIAGGKLEKRNFPEWTMGYRGIDSEILTKFKDDFLKNQDLETNNKDSHISVKLLNSFIKTARI